MNAAAGEEGAQVATEPATPGELLRRERERRKLSVQQTAEDLHLDAWTIEALESNRFNALGAPVYARGYLRKYALLLGLSPETVLARYESLSDVPVAPTPIPTSVSAPLRTERISLKRPLLIVAAVLGVALLGWIVQMLMSSPRAPTATIPPPVIEATPPTEAPAGPEAQAPAGLDAQAPQVETEAAPNLPQAAPTRREVPVASAPPPPTATGGSQVRLRLEFSETSWVEVYDANDGRLLFDLGAPGRVRTVTGAAPLRVTLGAASAVTAYVNDKPIVIPRRAGRDAAKFVVDAAGEVTPGSGR